MIDDVVLLLLKDRLESSRNLQEVFEIVTQFNLTNTQYHRVCSSNLGIKAIKEALIMHNITTEDIDRYVIKCFKNKNLFMLTLLLSLPNADIGLLVSKNKTTFRPSLFDRTKHEVSNENARLSPLLHLAIKEWPEAVLPLLDLKADIFSEDYYAGWIKKNYGRSIIHNYYEFFNTGMSPLHVASIQNNTEAMLQLIARGAEVNATDEHGRTPLHMAALYNNPDAIDILIKNGANKEKVYLFDKPATTTPLFCAMSCANTEAVNTLLKHNCSLDYDEGTILYLAIFIGHIDLITILVRRDPTLLDRHIEIIEKAFMRSFDEFHRDTLLFLYFKGLTEVYYPLLYRKIDNLRIDFLQKLMGLAATPETKQKIKIIALKSMIKHANYAAADELLGLKSKVFDEDLLPSEEWLSLLSETNDSYTKLHVAVMEMLRPKNNNKFIFDCLLNKAEEVGFDFSLKGRFGGSIGGSIFEIAKLDKNAPNHLKQRLLALEQASLCGAHLRGMILSKTNVSGMNISAANFNGVDLSGNNLNGALLVDAAALNDAAKLKICLKRFDQFDMDNASKLILKKAVLKDILSRVENVSVLEAAYEHPYFSRHRDDTVPREKLNKAVADVGKFAKRVGSLFSSKPPQPSTAPSLTPAFIPTESQQLLKEKIDKLKLEEKKELKKK